MAPRPLDSESVMTRTNGQRSWMMMLVLVILLTLGHVFRLQSAGRWDKIESVLQVVELFHVLREINDLDQAVP